MSSIDREQVSQHRQPNHGSRGAKALWDRRMRQIEVGQAAGLALAQHSDLHWQPIAPANRLTA